MAAAIPLIGAFASVSAGVAAGVGTFAGFALTAGGILTGLGAITGKQDLVKIGALMSLGGGIASAAASTPSANAATAGLDGAKEAFRAAEYGMEGAPNSLMSRAAATELTRGAQSFPVPEGQAPTSPAVPAADPLQQAASQLTQNDIQNWSNSLMERARAMGSGLTDFVKQNKELVSLGGNALASMYGPQAEQLDFSKSLYERRRRNLNSPVVMGRGVA